MATNKRVNLGTNTNMLGLHVELALKHMCSWPEEPYSIFLGKSKRMILLNLEGHIHLCAYVDAM